MIDRRKFLKASGVSLALPLLESMSPAWAKDASTPKRAVFLCTTLGLHAPALFPKKTGADYELTDYLGLLKEHRKDFTLFSGLSHPGQGGEHQCEMTWLSAAPNPGMDGFRNSISIDQYAATKLGYVTRFPSISLSSDNTKKSQSYTNSGVMVPAEYRPSRMFAKMFLKGKPEEIARQKQKLVDGRSILDELMGQTKALLKTSTAADRDRLEEYFNSVRTAENDLAEAQAWLARPKPQVEAKPPQDIHDQTDLIGRIKLLLNLVPLIIQTDSSRVISIVIQSNHGIPKINGVDSEHHNLSHHGRDPKRIDQLIKIERAIVNCFGDFLASMKAKREGNGTLLDNTLTLFGSNLGNASAHDPRNNPILLAGGGLKHGRYLAHDPKNNTPLCNLFLHMLNQMGLETENFAGSTGELTL
ncbi:MAG: DUF1552 domain-containing protein [Verrucomicrobiales bacterium]|nr:DUF1552 domain-containing protein [Verrucomicrobiales bacterium]MBT5846286.1 DUF1552 domain-containing protein [Verrucomicrobiales bacterium]